MSAPSPDEKALHLHRRSLIIAAGIVGVLVVAIAAIALSARSSDDDGVELDWSGFPRILNCASVPQGAESSQIPSMVQNPAPDQVLARAVRMEHPSDQRLKISVEFVGTPPPAPDQVLIPGYGDQRFNEPGTSDFSVVVFPGGPADDESYNLNIHRDDTAADNFVRGQWMVAGDSNFTDDTPAEGITTAVEEVAIAENTISFTIDLAAFPPVAAAWGQPVDVSIYPRTNTYPDPSAGGGLIQYQRQECNDMTASVPPTTEATASRTSPTTSSPATPPQIGRSSESSESEAGDLFAGVPVSPGTCADGGICQLSAPSGNYYCTISRTGAFCSPPLGEPLTAGTDARLISVGTDGETTLLADSGGNSHMEDRQTMSEFALPYGNTLTAYGMTCAFQGATGGASCRHDTSGQGFTVDPAQYRFF